MNTERSRKRIFAGFLAFALTAASAGAPAGAGAAAKPRLNKTKATIRVGGTVKLKVLHKKKSVKWSSSSKKTASVSKSGLVKGKKKGTAKITAKTGGKKYTCRVTVKAKANPSPSTEQPANTAAVTNAPSQPTGTPGAGSASSQPPTGTPGAGENPSQPPAGTPGAGENPAQPPAGTPGAGENPAQPPAGTPGAGENPAQPPAGTPGAGENPAQPPAGTPGAGENPAQPPAETPKQTDKPSETTNPGGSLEASHQVPPASGDDTLTVGTMSVTLGMTRAQVEASIGAGPDRTEKSPLGFDVFVYNPSGDYTNYLLLQFDQDKVVGMSTISNYFTYENILTGQQDKAGLTDGFTSIKSKYDYEAGYRYDGDKEYVLAFVDHQGSNKVYAVEILAKETSKSTGDTNLDLLFKAENGSYDETVNRAMAGELFELACAFRAVKGLPLFTPYDSDAAQRHSEDMAANTFLGMNSSNGTTREDRFEDAYPGYTGSAECVACRSLDAFGFVTWMVDDTDNSNYSILTRTADKAGIELFAYYLCTGFAANTEKKGGVTYAALDLFYY